MHLYIYVCVYVHVCMYVVLEATYILSLKLIFICLLSLLSKLDIVDV